MTNLQVGHPEERPRMTQQRWKDFKVCGDYSEKVLWETALKFERGSERARAKRREHKSLWLTECFGIVRIIDQNRKSVVTFKFPFPAKLYRGTHLSQSIFISSISGKRCSWHRMQHSKKLCRLISVTSCVANPAISEARILVATECIAGERFRTDQKRICRCKRFWSEDFACVYVVGVQFVHIVATVQRVYFLMWQVVQPLKWDYKAVKFPDLNFFQIK